MIDYNFKLKYLLIFNTLKVTYGLKVKKRFSGINESNLEMLFLDPQYFRKGYGTEILQTLISEHKIQYVDVNKDNPNAVAFYIKMGLKSMENLQKMHKEKLSYFTS